MDLYEGFARVQGLGRVRAIWLPLLPRVAAVSQRPNRRKAVRGALANIAREKPSFPRRGVPTKAHARVACPRLGRNCRRAPQTRARHTVFAVLPADPAMQPESPFSGAKPVDRSPSCASTHLTFNDRALARPKP